MREFGNFSLCAAFLLSLYGLGGGLLAASTRHYKLTLSARNALSLAGGFTVLSLICLGYAFVTHDYQTLYVWQHSNNAMHPLYLISAIWGGMDGSMLLWAAIMGIFSFLLVTRRNEGIPRDIVAWLIPILSGAIAFFLGVVTILTNPFRLVPPGVSPTDGNGLNPLLQNPSMLIHPPMLYCGFTGFVIPMAFCLAALCSGNLQAAWTKYAHRWTLVAWAFLTTGIILGGNWAYIELGWGGFWAWDPVENASFLPWLTGTAYLHSVMVQERRGMLKVWNVALSVLTYLLTVFGTFLTRSGVVQSVHAFAESDVGNVFLAYLAVVFLLAVFLIVRRWKDLRPENRIESFFSREAVFLFNNLILLAICFATFWGVMFPIFSEALGGTKSVVGPPFFNAVNVPLFLALLFFMGVGPLLSWKKTAPRTVLRNLSKPLITSFTVVAFALWIDPSRPLAALGFGFSILVLLAVYYEVKAGAMVRRHLAREAPLQSVANLLKRKSSRYGGLLAHVGAAVMAIAITASMAYKIQREFTLRVGEKLAIGAYVLQLEKLQEKNFDNYASITGAVHVFDRSGTRSIGYLYPERRHYLSSDETTAEIALRMTAKEDLYLALGGIDFPDAQPDENLPLERAQAAFKVFINPLQIWLWIGGGIMLLGTLLVLKGSSARVPVVVSEKVIAEVA